MKAASILFTTAIIFGAATINAQTGTASIPVTEHFSDEAWLEDFQQLVTEMDSQYADLEWAVSYRHMDLPKLRADTEEKIRQSRDDQSAKRAIEQFVSAFGDGHFSVSWPSTQPQAAASERAPQSESLCARIGFHDRSKPGINFSLLPGFLPVPAENAELFPGGLLTVPNGKMGVIRIADFDEHGFPLACEIVLRTMHLQDDSLCDRDCGGAITIKTANFLTNAIVMRVKQFRSLGASAILVDVTHNDGGDDWNEAVARSLSRLPLVDERRGFIKHPALTKVLEEDLRYVQSDREHGAEPRRVLDEAASGLRRDIELSKQSCDRSSAFVDGSLGCSLVVDGGLFWSGVLPYAKPGSFAQLGSKTILFNPLQYDYSESALQLPLFVAVDAHTWSSAERFAALLQDNQAATIIGELTGGAGCGFVDGGIPATLTHSRGQVEIPNCVGFRKDGSNANAGVTPNVLLPWAPRDTPYLRADKLRLGLIQALREQSTEGAPAH